MPKKQQPKVTITAEVHVFFLQRNCDTRVIV